MLKGYNGTIFAYGQTGTGKTYTMVGDFEDKKNRGIIPRAFDYIFETIPNDKEHKYNIMVSFIQIYLETIQDLLEPNNKDIRIREDPEQGVYLEGVQWVKVSSTADCANVFHFGEKNRVTESTRMNMHSSRSHAIFIARIEKSIQLSKEKIDELSKETNEKIKAERVMTRSMLYLVDLAGSERVKKTKAENMRLEEAKKINYSLLILGNCIQSLSEGKQNYVSYRDSKLTRLLQESLGGNAKTTLIVTVSPSGYNADETYSSLNFALRAMKVQNKPIINKSVDYQALCIKLQEDLDKLNDQYAELKIKYDKVVEENAKLKGGEIFVEMQRKSIANSLYEDGDTQDDTKGNKNVFELAKDAKKSKTGTKGKDKVNLEAEMKKLETFYEGLLKSKTEEYENLLKDIDKILVEKENSIDKLTNENKALLKKIDLQTDSVNDLKKEKEDLMNSVTDLTNKLTYEIESNKKKNTQEHKAELDKLNNVIETLEAKIIPLENMNTLNNDSINTYQNKIEQIIKTLKNEKNTLQQSKSNIVIKTSQNEIKIKINSDEIQNLNKKMETVTDEMRKILVTRLNEANSDIQRRQNENFKLSKNKDYITEKLDLIEGQIKAYKKLKENIQNLKSEDIAKKDKTDMICESILNEMNSTLSNTKDEFNSKKISQYEDELLQLTNKNDELSKKYNELQSQFNDRVNEQIKISNEKKEIEIQMKNLTRDLQKLSNENASLKEKSIGLSKTYKEIEQKSKTESERIKVVDQQIKDKTDELEKVKSSYESLQKEYEKIKSDLSQKEKTHSQINDKMNTFALKEKDYQAKISNYLSQIDTLAKDLKSKEKIVNDSINANESINQKLHEKEQEILKIKNELEKQKEEALQLNESISNLTESLSIKDIELEQYKRDKEEKETTISNLHKEIEKQENDIKELNIRIEEKDNDIEKGKLEIEQKNEKITQMKLNIDSLTNELNEINKKYESNLLQNSDVENKTKIHIDELNSSLTKKTNEINSLTEKNEKLSKQIETLTNTNIKNAKNLNDKITILQNEKDQLQKKIEISQKEATEKSSKNESLQKQYDQLKMENKKLKSELNLKELKISSMTQLTKQISDQIVTISSKEKEIKNLKENISTLNQELSKAQNDNSKITIEKESLQREQIEKNSKLLKLNEQLSQKENEILTLTQNNNSIKTELSETKNKYNTLIQTHNQIKSDNSKLKEDISSKEKQINTVNTEVASKIKNLYSNLSQTSKIYKKYQNEIEKIQLHISKNNTSFDLSELNQLIDNDNDESLSSEGEIPQQKEENISLDQCVNDITHQLQDSKTKFNQLVSAYYETASMYKQSSNDKDKLKQELIKNIHNVLTLLSSDQSSVDLSSILEEKQKEINGMNSSPAKNIIGLYNNISMESIQKLLSFNNEKNEEISHLKERIEYILKEMDIIKKSNEEINRGASSSFKVQSVKYESQLRLKNEEINKLNKRIEEHLKTINTNKKQIISLTQEIHEVKDKLEKQNQNWEKQERDNMLEKLKIANKDVSTGKFLIKEYFNKVLKFSDDISRYCDKKD